MNQLDAFILVRKLAMQSPERCLPQNLRALKVMDNKIAALTKKKEWRECTEGMPAHAKHPDHPLNKTSAPLMRALASLLQDDSKITLMPQPEAPTEG